MKKQVKSYIYIYVCTLLYPVAGEAGEFAVFPCRNAI